MTVKHWTLISCRFCSAGSAFVAVDGQEGRHGECRDCGAQGPWFSKSDDPDGAKAAAAWNAATRYDNEAVAAGALAGRCEADGEWLRGMAEVVTSEWYRSLTPSMHDLVRTSFASLAERACGGDARIDARTVHVLVLDELGSPSTVLGIFRTLELAKAGGDERREQDGVPPGPWDRLCDDDGAVTATVTGTVAIGYTISEFVTQDVLDGVNPPGSS